MPDGTYGGRAMRVLRMLERMLGLRENLMVCGSRTFS